MSTKTLSTKILSVKELETMFKTEVTHKIATKQLENFYTNNLGKKNNGIIEKINEISVNLSASSVGEVNEIGKYTTKKSEKLQEDVLSKMINVAAIARNNAKTFDDLGEGLRNLSVEKILYNNWLFIFRKMVPLEKIQAKLNPVILEIRAKKKEVLELAIANESYGNAVGNLYPEINKQLLEFEMIIWAIYLAVAIRKDKIERLDKDDLSERESLTDEIMRLKNHYEYISFLQVAVENTKPFTKNLKKGLEVDTMAFMNIASTGFDTLIQNYILNIGMVVSLGNKQYIEKFIKAIKEQREIGVDLMRKLLDKEYESHKEIFLGISDAQSSIQKMAEINLKMAEKEKERSLNLSSLVDQMQQKRNSVLDQSQKILLKEQAGLKTKIENTRDKGNNAKITDINGENFMTN